MDLKILMVSADYLPHIGGIAAHIYNLSKYLINLGNQVVILTTYKEKKKRLSFFLNCVNEIFQKREGIFEYHIPYPHIIFKGESYSRSTIEYGIIKRLMIKYKFDIIHWHSYYEDFQSLKRIHGTPKIFTNHSSMFLKEYESAPLKVKRRFFFADTVITTSNELKQKTKILGYPEKRIVYIPNGVDTKRFRPYSKKRNMFRSKFGIKKEEIVVICVRRFAEKNGIHIFLDAIPIIRKRLKEEMGSIVFVFAGNSKVGYTGYESDVIERCKSLKNKGVNIKMLGKIPHKNIHNIYRMADISVVPSLTEATSLSVLESLSTEVPVVASDIPGINDIIEDRKTGVLFESNNPEELAKKISELIQDKKMRKHLGSLGRMKVIRSFDWNFIAKKTLEVYDRTIKNFQLSDN